MITPPSVHAVTYGLVNTAPGSRHWCVAYSAAMDGMWNCLYLWQNGHLGYWGAV